MNKKLLLILLVSVLMPMGLSCMKKEDLNKMNLGDLEKLQKKTNIIDALTRKEVKVMSQGDIELEKMGKKVTRLELEAKLKKLENGDEDDEDLTKILFGREFHRPKIGDMVAKLMLHTAGKRISKGMKDKNKGTWASLGGALGDIFVWGGTATFFGGTLNSVQNAVEKTTGGLLESLVTLLLNGYNRLRCLFFHNGSEEITARVIACWKQELHDIYKKLSKVSSKAHDDDEIGQKLMFRQYQSVGSGEENEEKKKQIETKEKTVDWCWKQNQHIFLNRLQFIVESAERHKKYYKKSDRIVMWLNQLIAALAGNREERDVLGEGLMGGKEEKVVLHTNGISGGACRVIQDTHSVYDFSKPNVVTSFELFYYNAMGVLNVLESWLESDKQAKQQAKNFLSDNTATTGGIFGN